MGFKLRTESFSPASNLEDLEQAKKAAALDGPASLEQFESSKLGQAIKEAPATEATPPTDTSSDDSSSGDDSDGDDDFDMDFGGGGDDSSTDSDTGSSSEEESEEEPDESEEEESEEEEDEAEIKTESIRTLEPIPSDMTMRLENAFFEGLADASLKGWGAFTFVAGVLGTIGLKYGPTVLAGMFKVVIYTFARVFQLLGTIHDVCAQRIDRYVNSYEKQKARILAVSENLKTVLESGAALPDRYGDFQFPATWLSLPTNANALEVLNYQRKFTDEKFGHLLKLSKGEFDQLREISGARYLGKHFDALSYLQIDPAKLGFKPLVGFIGAVEEGTQQASLGIMAGNVECIAYLPDTADNWNSVEKNYNAAKFELRIRPEVTTGEDVAPLSPKELVNFVSALDDLIEANKKHQLFYEELEKARSGVLTSVKALFVQLVRSQTRISFKDSVALPLFLKTSLATKVYLVAAMDIQDHNAKVIANALVYVDRVMKIYQKPVKEVVPSQMD